MVAKRGILRASVLSVSMALPSVWLMASSSAIAQTAAAAAPKIGTVKAISGSSITLATDAGQQISIMVPSGTRILQLAPGSKDLKAAQPITLNGISVGDRVLVAGKAGEDANSFTASRVILMKAQAIAAQHEAEQADWQKRGIGGLVSAVDDASGTITVSVGPRKLEVHTSSATRFRRYSGASVKFEDAQPGTLAQIHAGDQIRVLGNKSEDGQSVQAEVIVSGSFLHLAGTIASIDAANNTLTLKDLATKKMMTVKLTPDSNVRKLPPEAAARFAARARGGAGAHGQAGGARHVAGQQSGAAGAGQDSQAQEQRAAGMDLSQMLNRLPTETISDLKQGDAVMIVASQQSPASNDVTAVTLLSGVEPILAATPKGSATMNLSPWNVGGGTPDAGGGDNPQ
ncbi:MAG TPA: DUF5666 domain-containing protein [Edaphobacter sp.]|nr:DUF5666 domain-containing protein [Edaphobacter sp.]